MNIVGDRERSHDVLYIMGDINDSHDVQNIVGDSRDGIKNVGDIW